MAFTGTITYRYPASVAGGAVAPTAAQAVGNEVTADIVFNVGDTGTNLVHNMAISASGNDGTPRISVQTLAAGTALNTVVIATVDANTISVTPVLTAANTSQTVRINIQRPFSMTR